ncbi:uncharacterized protein LOC124663404 [Lolium rigidum]|uniref:uncharacterized protein LOC124663404 n=1 Tax=Lolium rigidum TaxID=89674 RepID=UPI001F5C8A46|nr:uncharacterized protein LOC124663404 [Lolium rigidum]
MDRLQQRPHDALTGRRTGGGSSMSRRQGRFHHGGTDSDDDGGSGPPSSSSSAPVVDHAECTARSCRSCVAVSLADCIALGCCPCAVVSLLGLALVKAPLALGRRCVRRLLRRRGRLRQKKRVRDDMVDHLALAADGKRAGHAAPGDEEDDVAVAAAAAAEAAAASDADRVWLEMYQVGQWGFGRLSFSVNVNPPPKNGDGDGCQSHV